MTSNVDFSDFKIKQWLVVFIKALDHFMVFLSTLIAFEPILDVFLFWGEFWKDARNSDKTLFSITSCDVITS